MSFQVFIKGTSFDVLNSMAFNYVAGCFWVSGSGSRTFPSLNVNYEVVILNSFNSTDINQRDYNVSVSGNTVSWSVPNSVMLLVITTANVGANSQYGGFAYYEYPNGQRTVKLAPDFLPFNLTQVLDIGPGAGEIATNVPLNKEIIAFHRGTDTSFNSLDRMIYEYVSGNGVYNIRVTNNPIGGRIYVFSNMLVNIPTSGFYMYRDGQMVWHSNCLPLNIKRIPNGRLDSDQPMACPSSVTANIKIQVDPQYPVGYDNRQCNSAGYSQGRWRVDIGDTFYSRFVNDEQTFRAIRPWAVGGYPAYIETSIYDQYYKAALGV